jgi:hypothetical protein
MKKSIQNGGPFDIVHFITAFVTTREIRLLRKNGLNTKFRG